MTSSSYLHPCSCSLIFNSSILRFMKISSDGLNVATLGELAATSGCLLACSTPEGAWAKPAGKPLPRLLSAEQRTSDSFKTSQVVSQHSKQPQASDHQPPNSGYIFSALEFRLKRRAGGRSGLGTSKIRHQYTDTHVARLHRTVSLLL